MKQQKQPQNTFTKDISSKTFECIKKANEFKTTESNNTRELKHKYNVK